MDAELPNVVIWSRSDLIGLVEDVYRVLKQAEFKYESSLTIEEVCHWCGRTRVQRHDRHCTMNPLLHEMREVLRDSA